MWQRARLRLIIFVAGSLLTLWTAATLAQEMQPGEQYQGVIVACSRQDEAEALTGLVVSGDLEKAKTYLQSEDNSCDVGPYQFIVSGLQDYRRTTRDRRRRQCLENRRNHASEVCC